MAGCGSHSTSGKEQFDGAVFPAGVRAPNFDLPDLGGNPVSLGSQRGHVVALVFMPGDCRTCLLVAEQLRGALDELESHAPRAPKVRTILINTNPAVTPAGLRGFLARNELLGRVSYLTASGARLRPVWNAYHAVKPGSSASAAEDAITVLLIDKRGSERVGFGIEQITPEGLSHDIGLLQAG
ncbi:MAG: peroxiredoxin family protein [Solirubrobacteraceae bacterium]